MQWIGTKLTRGCDTAPLPEVSERTSQDLPVSEINGMMLP